MSSSYGYRYRCTYSNLKDELLATILGLNGVENRRELLTLEFDCEEVRYADLRSD